LNTPTIGLGSRDEGRSMLIRTASAATEAAA
jgi:hypothetical protein